MNVNKYTEPKGYAALTKLTVQSKHVRLNSRWSKSFKCSKAVQFPSGFQQFSTVLNEVNKGIVRFWELTKNRIHNLNTYSVLFR